MLMPDLNLKISLSSKTVIFSMSLLTICSSYSVTRLDCVCRNLVLCTKIHAIKATIDKAIDYICNPDKTDEQIYVSSYACAPETAAIEFNANSERRTHVFYCDPQRSDQKGGIEVTHEMIRRVLPKKTSFDHLTQDNVSLMMSHINSYKRKKLGNRSAYQLFSFLHDEGLLEMLGITLIPSKEINLTPLLLKK